ncbi:trimeric porin PorB.IB [Thiomicrorhabdus hydrogeniphila]
MKKNIIALAIASAVAAPVAMADAPVVYGQFNMAVEQIDSDTAAGTVKKESGTQVNSRASRLGVKGSEDLGNGLKAIYKMEFEVQPDEGDTLKNRNQYVGLAGGFGTVLMGRHDTPTKMIQAKDLFNDAGLADNKPMAGGLGMKGNGMENRVSNVLAYVSPSFSGVKLIAALVPKETGGSTTDESSLSDMYSVALTYGSAKKGLYLAAGMDTASEEFISSTGTGGDATQSRLVAQYATGGLVANVMYQDFGGKAIKGSEKEGTNIQANLAYKMGKFTPKLKISSVDREKGAVTSTAASASFNSTTGVITTTGASTAVTDEDSMNYAIGLDYALGKKTTAYVEYASLENVGGVKKDDTTAVSVGLLHKF